MKKMHLTNEPNLEKKYKAFPYQEEAFNAVKDLEYAAIFHEQGLGKTKIAIDLALYWIDQTDIDTVLIVAKKQLVRNWQIEFSNHTYMKPSIISDDKKSNYYVFNGPARIIITHFETFQSERERYSLFLKTRNIAIIMDESAKIKNPGSALTKTFFEISYLFKKRVIMTGTPVANRPYDIWSQIYFLDNGKSLGKDFKIFKNRTELANDLYENPDKTAIFEKAISGIFESICKFSVRETKNSGIICLPEKIFIEERADFEPIQFKMYEEVRLELRIELIKDGEVIIDDDTAIVKRLLRLLQIISNPKLLDEKYSEISSKEKLLENVISKITVANEKCIVWTSFVENVNSLCKKYSKYGSVKIHGGMKIEDRNISIARFKTDDFKILFATPASAKEGLTLTMANHVIFYDRSFSLDDYLQAQDRIHRISQTKNCYVHNLIINDSIDEWISVLLAAKQNAAALTQGDIDYKTYKEISDYSFGEIIKMILVSEEKSYE